MGENMRTKGIRDNKRATCIGENKRITGIGENRWGSKNSDTRLVYYFGSWSCCCCRYMWL